MNKWPDTRLLELLAIDAPILQAPMAGAGSSALAIAVARAGGLGAIPCASISPARLRAEVAAFRAAVAAPLNLNFFAHRAPVPDPAGESRWQQRLTVYYQELGVEAAAAVPTGGRAPFDENQCALVKELRPEVVSFHFGLPAPALLARVKATGAKLLSSATTVAEGRWLEAQGCDAIIAQGYEAGGHRGSFLTQQMSSQPGTIALVPQMVDAVRLPVIAAGGIGDARGIVAALALGASGVQMGTAYLSTDEATIAEVHRSALRAAHEDATAVTNVFTGRPARGLINRMMREVGWLSELAPAFPLAGSALAPLRAVAEPAGCGDFQPLWAGQAAALNRELPAQQLTQRLIEETLERLSALR